jgi:hypothetical protein
MVHTRRLEAGDGGSEQPGLSSQLQSSRLSGLDYISETLCIWGDTLTLKILIHVYGATWSIF